MCHVYKIWTIKTQKYQSSVWFLSVASVGAKQSISSHRISNKNTNKSKIKYIRSIMENTMEYSYKLNKSSSKDKWRIDLNQIQCREYKKILPFYTPAIDPLNGIIIKILLWEN